MPLLQQGSATISSSSGSISKRRSVFCVCLIVLFLLSACLVVAVAHAAADSSSNGTTSLKSNNDVESLWDADIFNLPPDVPFPGADWLQRIATPETTFVDQATGRSYSSAYAFLLQVNNDDPLQNPCRNFNAYMNSIFFSPSVVEYVLQSKLLGGSVEATHYFLTYARNFIGAMIVYYGVAGIFHYFCYVHKSTSHQIFEAQKRPRPSSDIIWDQIQLAQSSMALYVLYTIVDEFLVSEGYTRVYFTIAEIGGWKWYLATMACYFCCVEMGIYWMHRALHTNKWLYKHVHLKHHKYNKAETLTPWASIAFHPVDGILQASPYTLLLPFVPCHYPTHFGLLFFTAIWATYIHDAMDFNIFPIMGSKYHTVHHTHYLYNYGQVFIFCDWFWGTLRTPTAPTGVPTSSSSSSSSSTGRRSSNSAMTTNSSSRPKDE